MFRTETTGKWILAGEHAVLRGAPALVFPLESRKLNLDYTAGAPGESLRLMCGGSHGDELQMLFWGVLEKACELKEVSRSSFHGEVRLTSEIPVGAGLGASAALCVAMSRWFAHLNVIQPAEIADFARTLENLFHGESSGLDIAVAIKGKPLKYFRGQEPQVLPERRWTPELYVSYSGQRGMTLDCVSQVKRLLVENSERGQQLDAQMGAAAELCEKALQLEAGDGPQALAQAMDLAAESFRDWGLTEGAVQNHMNQLRTHGALAVKPTGSGKGGYILSLWTAPPPTELRSQLIPCFKS
ncbi:MAG: hypothetical protein KF681_01405 [Bdellovibrionaceae bacterium]|nr:hypothetical protein [Pseudobdellovibrionaceae bacterium]